MNQRYKHTRAKLNSLKRTYLQIWIIWLDNGILPWHQKPKQRKRLETINMKNNWAGEMARWVKAAVAKPDDPSMTSGTHTVEGEM